MPNGAAAGPYGAQARHGAWQGGGAPGMWRRLRTGVNGGVAFAATFLGAQAWGGIGWGIAALVTGIAANSVNNSVYDGGSNCSSGYGYCSDAYGSVNHVAGLVVFAGVLLVIAGIGLLVGMIALLMGRRSGRAMVIVFEALFIAAAVIWAIQAHAGGVLVFAIIPVTVILCIVFAGTRRMLADRELNYSSPNP